MSKLFSLIRVTIAGRILCWHITPKAVVGICGPLRLPRKPRRLRRMVSHPMGEYFNIPFMLNPELAEGAKHERANSHLTAVLRINVITVGIVVVTVLAGCQAAYYGAMEQLGYHKRDLLVSDVRKARDAQEEAKEQFQTAFDQFSTVLNFKGGALQDTYEKLNAEYERSESKAQVVHDRIASVEDVSEALFREWEAELGQYSNARLRRVSRQKLNRTRSHYSQLIKAMKRAEKKMGPVLAAFKDQVLFLKHNLNAQAIASLKQELVSVESDIASLIKDMEASIGEADSFITAMGQETG